MVAPLLNAVSSKTCAEIIVRNQVADNFKVSGRQAPEATSLTHGCGAPTMDAIISILTARLIVAMDGVVARCLVISPHKFSPVSVFHFLI
jgi:hypothetical protein